MAQQATIEVARTLSLYSFRQFVQIFWNSVSNDKFCGGLIVDAICEHLEALNLGKTKRLAVACPIRHGKSIITSVFFPVWLWLHDPTLRILTVSHGERNAHRDSLKSRQLIDSPLFQQIYGSYFKLALDQNQKGFYQNDKLGFRLALGSGSATSGADADIVIADDILDYDAAKSEAERENVKDYFNGTLCQRVVMGNGKDRILLVGHRVHEDDVFADVFGTHGNTGDWSYLVLPAEAQPDITNGFKNATGWKEPRREGELLNPERFPLAVLNNKKKELRHKYYCLFQQDPSPASGDLFKAEWFRYWNEDATHYNLNGRFVPKDKCWRFATVDTAITVNANSDYTVCQVWDVIGNDMVLVDQMRQKLDGNRIIPALKAMNDMYKPQFMVIEKEFVGEFVIDQLRALNVPVKKFRSSGQGNKETRAVAAEIRMEAARVWFPSNAGWMTETQKEIVGFPNGKHDDIVDCLSMAAITCNKYHGELVRELTEAEKIEKAKQQEIDKFNKILNANTLFR